MSEQDRRKILLIGKRKSFSPEACSYAVNLAERLDYDIVALKVYSKSRNASANLLFGAERKKPNRQETQCVEHLQSLVEQRGLHLCFTSGHGRVDDLVLEIIQEEKRIEFVVMDSDIDEDEMVGIVNIPIFSVMQNSSFHKKGSIMSETRSNQRKSILSKTLAYGALTTALYSALFMNAGEVMSYFTRGGWYAVLPIGTVFIFSFAHGTFASHFWSLLGIEALRKDSLQVTEKHLVPKRKPKYKKPRAYAYINPFHRF